MSSATRTQCPFDPMSPDIWTDPYPSYRALRMAGRIAWIEPPGRWHLLLAGGLTAARGFWMISSFAEVGRALLHPDLGHRPPGLGAGRAAETEAEIGGLTAIIDHWPLFLDPPAHARVKKALIRALARWSFEDFRAMAADVATQRLAALASRHDFDIVRDFAYEVPMRVIARLIGVDETDHERLTLWSYALYDALEFGLELDRLRAVNATLEEALDYFRALIEARKREPQEDLVSALLSAKEPVALTEDELLSNCMLLLFAGHDTTLNVIGNASLTLLRERSLLTHFVDKGGFDLEDLQEFLRHDSPQQLAFRYALRDIDLHGQRIAAGDLVCLALGSANRDDAVFDNPATVDVSRPGRPNFAFGKGAHICPGSSLGLAIAKAALDVLLPILPNCEAVSWSHGDNAIMRGLTTLVVRCGGVAGA